MSRLIDGQVDWPGAGEAGKMVGGGGPVSENVRRTDRDGDWSGSGRKSSRFAPKTAPIGNQRRPK
jgi:hypothetical protein